MKKSFRYTSLLLLAAALSACSSAGSDQTQTETPKETETTETTENTTAYEITGLWYSTKDANESIEFYDNGSVSGNLYFDGNKVTEYSLGSSQQLTLTIQDDDLSETLLPASSKAQAMSDDDYYYLDETTLVLDEVEYTRNQIQAEQDNSQSGDLNPNDNTMASDDGALIGTWDSNGTSITFNADGTVSDGFYFDGDLVTSWSTMSDGTLVLTVSDDGMDETDKIFMTTDQNQALNDDDWYYLEGDTLVLDQIIYTFNE